MARRMVLERLQAIRSGRLEVFEGRARHAFGDAGDEPGLRARMTVRDPSCWVRLARDGSIGAGEAFAQGLWTSPDPTAVVRVVARNRDALSRLDGGFATLFRGLARAAHLLQPNSLKGSRRNIAAHYDLGNDFFAQFLDPTMTYSCGVFDGEDAPLEAAQAAKLELVCRKLDLGPDDRLVEIGAGWGSLAIHAARTRGCRVVATTISREQFAYASNAVARAGLGQRVTVIREDYRNLPDRFRGAFDKLASIEMIEAVGHRFLPGYIRTVSELLAPRGLALIQAILISDQRYEGYRRSVDFIQKHIFPGGLLPSLARIQACVAKVSDLGLLDLEDLTRHYARTLSLWRARFEARDEAIAALGLSEERRRLWRFYFAYCEAGFLERTITDQHLLYAKPGFRGPGPLRGAGAPA